jgi:hypothetical protein
MALTKNITTNTGLSCTGAYIRAEQISLNKNGMTVEVRFKVGADSEPFESKNYEVPYDILGDNPFKQAYIHLKTLPEFADAVDA